MQCKDIPDEPILRHIGAHDGKWCMRWRASTPGIDWPCILDAMPADTPEKLVLAKMRRLIERGLVDGCPCGCRGDFVLTAKGRAYIGLSRGPRGLEPD